LGELKKVANLQWSEEALDRVAAKAGQRGIVEVGFHQTALRKEDLLDRPQKADLFGVVVVSLNVALEATLHYLRIVGKSVKREQMAKESEEVVHT
jgi:hypothetical protein